MPYKNLVKELRLKVDNIIGNAHPPIIAYTHYKVSETLCGLVKITLCNDIINFTILEIVQ